MKRALLILLVPMTVMAVEAPTLDPLPPRPQIDPLVPVRASGEQLDDNGALLDRVESRVRRLELEINGILRENQGNLPMVSVEDLPQLSEDRQLRDLAWEQLRGVLDAGLRPVGLAVTDPLEQEYVPTYDPGADPQVVSLVAENRLYMAQCHMELVAQDRAADSNMQEGSAILAGLTLTELPDSLHPEYYYLRVWYAVERSRRGADAAARSAELKAAEEALKVFEQAYPGHLRAANARLLLEQVSLDASVKAAKQEVGL
ncbi:MAG: hypothetical protein PF961_19255 [Planctomycetota bacterium]|jgi:hypothetical protein|nr:hypothetical protein [Planctomycetota bacterium]